MTMTLDRRHFLAGGAGLALAPAARADTPLPQIVWDFDNLTSIGGEVTHVEGHPRLIDSPLGKAVLFDGVADALFIDRHPLAGAKTFAFEAVFRPDGGAFEQRWFYLDETDPPPPPGEKAPDPHFTFEIRATPGKWYLDTYTTGPGYKQTLIVPDKQFALGQWYHVAQTYDGKTYRSFVDGAVQAEADIAYVPQGPGRSCVGTRINRVNYFKGAVAKARFTPWYLGPEQFLKLS
jgi:hypothetical protein